MYNMLQQLHSKIWIKLTTALLNPNLLRRLCLLSWSTGRIISFLKLQIVPYSSPHHEFYPVSTSVAVCRSHPYVISHSFGLLCSNYWPTAVYMLVYVSFISSLCKYLIVQFSCQSVSPQQVRLQRYCSDPMTYARLLLRTDCLVRSVFLTFMDQKPTALNVNRNHRLYTIFWQFYIPFYLTKSHLFTPSHSPQSLSFLC